MTTHNITTLSNYDTTQINTQEILNNETDRFPGVGRTSTEGLELRDLQNNFRNSLRTQEGESVQAITYQLRPTASDSETVTVALENAEHTQVFLQSILEGTPNRSAFQNILSHFGRDELYRILSLTSNSYVSGSEYKSIANLLTLVSFFSGSNLNDAFDFIRDVIPDVLERNELSTFEINASNNPESNISDTEATPPPEQSAEQPRNIWERVPWRRVFSRSLLLGTTLLGAYFWGDPVISATAIYSTWNALTESSSSTVISTNVSNQPSPAVDAGEILWNTLPQAMRVAMARVALYWSQR